jgi:prophage antirepressor-like protein
MANLTIIKSEQFNGVQCDFYRNENNDIFMTTEQLGTVLGYASKSGISNIMERNPYIKSIEFSGVHKMGTPSGVQDTRVFTEDGIYEVTMLAKTEKAKEFRGYQLQA